MGDPLTGSDAAQHHVFLGLTIGRDDHANRPADGLGGGVPEHALGRAIPRHDRAVQVLADDRVVRRLDNPGEVTKGDVIERFLHVLVAYRQEALAVPDLNAEVAYLG